MFAVSSRLPVIWVVGRPCLGMGPILRPGIDWNRGSLHSLLVQHMNKNHVRTRTENANIMKMMDAESRITIRRSDSCNVRFSYHLKRS